MKRLRTKIDDLNVIIDIHSENKADVLIKRGHFVVKEFYNVTITEEEIPRDFSIIKRRRKISRL